MKVTVMSVLLCFLLSLAEMHAQTFPSMRFNFIILPNHSYVDFNLVGNTTDESVKCRTNLTTCNNSTLCGDWYFPNGMRLPVDSGDPDVHVYEVHKRKHVLLYRQKSPVVSGIYRCDIESKIVNNKTINGTLYAGLYTSGGQHNLMCIPILVDECVREGAGIVSIHKYNQHCPIM